MANRNMNGNQSLLFKDMKEHIRSGGNVSHILHVDVPPPHLNSSTAHIRQKIFNIINRKRIVKHVCGVDVFIKWRSAQSFSSSSSAYYYHTDVNGVFGDRAVKEHTKQLLHDILEELGLKADESGIAFRVTRPLVRQIALQYDDDEDNGAVDDSDEDQT